METIRVTASTAYDIQIGSGLLDRIGTFTGECCPGARALLVTDETVSALYADRALQALSAAGCRPERFVLTPGEGSKTVDGWQAVTQALVRHGFTRSDCIVALGGGVVCDLAGFAAATYLRGIAWLAVPTTLLAMVDASVGGKTGIDLPQGKNLLGAFWQPRGVLCDPDVLGTLPPYILSDGLAEVIKYGMIGDETILDLLRQPFAPQAETIIARCIRHKCELVQQDERDNGIRRLLNFGHTVGHAIEQCSGYRISHGKAVAIGMAAMTKLAEHTGECADGIYWELCDLLQKCGLPTALPYTADELWQAACTDKKRQGDTVSLIVPIRRGLCRVRNVTADELREMLEVCETL